MLGLFMMDGGGGGEILGWRMHRGGGLFWFKFRNYLLNQRFDVLVVARLINLTDCVENRAVVAVIKALANLIQRQVRLLVCQCHAELPRKARWLPPAAS